MAPVEVAQTVRYVDFAEQFASERAGVLAAVEAVFARGDFINGEQVSVLEASISEHLGVAYTVAVNSGTDALMLSLLSLGIGRGDEVITAANSFIASAAAIARVGATPVFADVLPDQMLDPTSVEARITPRTRALMPVHLTGRVADMAAFCSIAERHSLAIVEDAAQAFGSRLGARCAGTFGQIGAFSAHPLKNFNAAGDAGFAVTNDVALAGRIRRLRNHGFVDRDIAIEFGFVSRMDTVQAAILNYRLPLLDGVVAQRRRNASAYRLLLQSPRIRIAPEQPGQRNSYHLFVIQTDERDSLRERLARRGVDTKIHYPTPIHLQPAARGLGYRRGALPETEWQADRILSLPIHQFLDPSQIAYVATEINTYLDETAAEAEPSAHFLSRRKRLH
jgi:dTDP-4-amino-4,6-dideoxygalactose transaminase